MCAEDSASPGAGRRFRAAGTRAAREPLLQFLAAALVLFAVNGLVGTPDEVPAGNSVTVSRGQVQQLAESYRLLAGRLPSRAELQVLVDDFVEEEIAWREAVALGLDVGDTIVRRRMRQKLQFLAEDADASEPPTDEELAARLESHAASYRLPDRVALRHILASGDARGARAEADAASFLDALQEGADPLELGDASMLPGALPLTTEKGVAALFGDAFASRVFEHAGEGWFGPVRSPYGAHAVRVTAREGARDPTVDEVRARLRSDWIEARRLAARERFLARLRSRYDVSIEWPDVYDAEPPRAAAPLPGSSARGGKR